jgi:hemolysin activation/secretion protein
MCWGAIVAFALSVEDRITLVRDGEGRPVFTLAPFIDMGAVWNSRNNPNPTFIDSNFIIEIGLGLIWKPIAGLAMRVDYGPPLVNLNVPDDSVQDSGFYFSLGYNF